MLWAWLLGWRTETCITVLQTLNGQNDDAWRQQHAQQQVQQAQQQQQQQQVQQAQQQQQQTPQQTPPSMHTAISGLKKDRDDNASGSPASGLDEADITVRHTFSHARSKTFHLVTGGTCLQPEILGTATR